MEFHFGELFPRVGFIVTNLETDSRALVRFDNKPGTAEQWIKEGKQAVKMARLSWEAFNVFNHSQFVNAPERNLGNSPPGRFLNLAFTDGGIRTMRAQLKLIF